MPHYRVYKFNHPKGRIIKGKDLQAPDDTVAMQHACDDPDCPVCEVWRGTTKVGDIQ